MGDAGGWWMGDGRWEICALPRNDDLDREDSSCDLSGIQLENLLYRLATWNNSIAVVVSNRKLLRE